MEKICDLHTHSFYSDGTWSPRELIDEAIRIKLSAIALCDHNTTDGLEPFLSYAEGKDILAVPGIEISSEYDGKELHILGLFIPMSKTCEVKEFLEVINRRKKAAYVELIKNLNADGYMIDLEKIKQTTPTGHINRAHIATALTQAGYTADNKEAFATLLSPDGKYYNQPRRYTSFEVIEFLNSLGAIPVLAHPLLSMDADTCDEFLGKATPLGLVGMETIYPTYTVNDTKKAKELAQKYSLKESGGSDFHGDRKPGLMLGLGYGELAVPFEFVNELMK